MILGGEHSRTCSAGDVPGQWLFSICTTPTPQLDLARSIINASLAGMRTYGRVSLKIQRRQTIRSEEHTSELQSLRHLVCRLLLEKKKKVARRIGYGVVRIG